MIPESQSDAFIEAIRARLSDRYEISRELFGGGMSRVFVAREIALDREIVIKFLPPEIVAEANRDRFRREIQMAAKLRHPHIAPLFAAGEEGDLLYYTMPFVAGNSLRQSLETRRAFGVGETVEILLDVADALAYAHRAGIIHRDIKPANILLEGGHAVVTDFGVAKAMSAALGGSGSGSGQRISTISGMAFGTPQYMAPEQIAADPTADHRVDIYAFGLLAYELLTGLAPFRGASPQAILAAQLTQAPSPILQLRQDVPPVLAALIMRCLEKEATRRPVSAESVLEILRTVSVASGASLVARPRRVSTVAWWIGGGVMAAVLAVVMVSLNRTPPTAADTAAKVDSTLLRAQHAASTAESTLRALNSSRARDSTRHLAERTSSQDKRLMTLLRDSIANALQRAQADSVAQAKSVEQGAARALAAISRSRGPAFTVPFSTGQTEAGSRAPLTPELFNARLADMGPPRRIAVSIHSSVRNPIAVTGATIIRDSLEARFRANARFVLVANDSVTVALAKSRTIDSLRLWLHSDMWVTLNASGDLAADSLRWSATLYDFSANARYTQNSTTSERVAIATATEPSTVTQLVNKIMRLLDVMDNAPRKS